MRIQQARVSPAIGGFTKSFLQKYKLKSYFSRDLPAVFFGCYHYNNLDLPAIMSHNAMAVIIFGGSDSIRLKHPACIGRYRQILQKKDNYFIAISRSVSEDLLRAKVPHTYLPVCPTQFKQWHPVPLGPHVYVYSSHDFGWKYGAKHIAEIKQRIPDLRFITGYASPPHHYTAAQMPEIYAQCFMGLRLTPHDGLANTVVELGLMGRHCIWNGWLPNAVHYKTINDVIPVIRRQRKRIGKTNRKLSCRVRRSLRLPREWLNVDFYKRLWRRGESKDGKATLR